MPRRALTATEVISHLAKLSAPEVDAVLAHELGHFKHKHVTQRMLMTTADEPLISRL